MKEDLLPFLLVSLFIRAPDLGFLKPLCSKAQFFVFGPARKIRDTNPFLLGVGLLIAYLIFSAMTEMGTRWPWKSDGS